jgi:S-formylglutathione hydrolase
MTKRRKSRSFAGGADVPDEKDSWDFGMGAGFYVDAVCEPWSKHYRMYSYVVKELPALIEANFPVKPNARLDM